MCYARGVNERTVTVREFRNHSAQVLDQIEYGDTVLLTRHGRVIARVVPVAASPVEQRRKLLASADDLDIPRGTFTDGIDDLEQRRADRAWDIDIDERRRTASDSWA